jgi:uncharacterized SAM-binding protein YcdF (DUF218 family)
MRKRWVLGVLGGMAGAVLCLWLHSAVQIYAYADVRSSASADAAIVLGAAVWGAEPSPVFAERINHAVDLYHDDRVAVLVLTGGRGVGDTLSEAEVAQRYAMARGVPASDIYVETESHITYGNLRGAQSVMVREGLTCALLVSDPLHMRRSMHMAGDLGLAVAPSPTPTTRYRTWRTRLGFWMRESRLYAVYRLKRVFL